MTHARFTSVGIPLLWLLIQTGPAVISVLAQDKPEQAAAPLVAPFDKDQARAAQAAWVRQLKIELSHRVGLRPDRVEPRAIKRRPSGHKRLMQPRAVARAQLLRGRA